MLKMSKKLKIGLGVSIAAAVFAFAPFVVYLKVLPAAVSNPKVISFVEKQAQKLFDLKLDIKNPQLKTSLMPDIEFKVDSIDLSNKSGQLLEVDNFDTEISFKEIFDKNIIVKKLGADYIFANVNKLMSLAQPQEQTGPQEFDWNFDFFDSVLYIKKSLFLYKLEPSTYVSFNADDINIDNTQKEFRYIHFNLTSDIKKDGKNLHFNITDRNSVYIKDKAIWVDKCYLTFNKTKIFFNAMADKKKNYNLEVFSDKIYIPDIITLISTNISGDDFDEILSLFKDVKGDLNFNVKLTNNDLNGIVNLNNVKGKIVPINNLPVLIEQGKISINNDVITLSDFEGFYNNRKDNSLQMEGDVKDYLKSVDTNIIIRAAATDDFMKNYLSKMAGVPFELVGGSTKTRLDVKSVNNKIDLKWLFGLKVGQDILIDGTSLTPANYRRMLKADMHFIDNILNIETIDYYIAPEDLPKEKRGKIPPVIKVAGNIDCSTQIPEIKNLGFEIPNPLPSEFLNVLVGDKLFKGGKIAGNMEFVNTGKYPVLDGKLTMDEVRIPSQRIFLKHGEMLTANGLLKLAADGKYRRSAYDFDGSLVNLIKFPIVVKNVNLTVDDVDIEKFIASANMQNSQEITNEKFDVAPSGEARDDDDNTPTFDVGNFIVEDCNLNILKGKYKDINFNDVKGTLTLNKNGILDLHSNRFEIAEGISSAKINCDLKKHKYYMHLGIKDVNSDLIASTILELKKEISGKASGLIELNTDDSLKLNGLIKFAVKDGTIQKVGLVEYVLKFAALFRNPLVMISPSIFTDLVNIPEGNFDSITGSLDLKDNVIERMMIKSSSPQLSSFIAGRYNLETGDAALRIYTKFSNKNKGFAGFLRNISLNSLANRIPLSSRNDSNYYEAELSQLPPLDADEKDCQIFLTKVDGDVEHNNFISSLKKIK